MSIIENKKSVFLKNQGMHYSIEWIVKHLTFPKSPFHYLIIITLIAFVAEAFVMNIISYLEPLSPWIKALSDSTFLVILLFPALYFFLFRPLTQHIIELKQAEEAVQKAYEELEERVEERTTELLKTSEELKQEIKERVEAEKALRESEARYRGLFDNMIEGVAVYEVKNDGEDFVFIDLNEAGEKISATSKDAVIGQSVLKMFPGVKDLGLFEVFQRVWRTGKPKHHPIAQYKDGRIDHWAENSIFKLPSGEVVAVYSDETERIQAEEALRKAYDNLERLVEERTAELVKANDGLKREIEDRKQAIEALRKSEERYRILTENVADGVSIVQDRRLQFANDALSNIFGYTVDQLVGKEPIVFFCDEYKQRFKELLEVLEKGTPVGPFQAPCIKRSGQEIWVEERYNIIEWKGRPAILVTVRDITENKLQEIAMKEEKTFLRSENIKLKATIKDRYKFGDIVGKSPAMQKIYELILKTSSSDANVVIYGESGTGKDLVARTIHDMSDRRNKAFVPVNCGAVPENLFEREFFGHRKGAFTGAHIDTHGFFDYAHEGTLFLDEVGELTLKM